MENLIKLLEIILLIEQRTLMTRSSRVFKFWSCPLSTQQSQFRLSYLDTSSHIVSTYKSMLQEAVTLCICLSVSWVLGTEFILCHSLSYRSKKSCFLSARFFTSCQDEVVTSKFLTSETKPRNLPDTFPIFQSLLSIAGDIFYETTNRRLMRMVKSQEEVH